MGRETMKITIATAVLLLVGCVSAFAQATEEQQSEAAEATEEQQSEAAEATEEQQSEAAEATEEQQSEAAEALAGLHMLGLEIEAFADASAKAFAAREDFATRGDVTRENFEREVFGQDQWLGERSTLHCIWNTFRTEDLSCVREFYEGKVEQAANLVRSLNVSQAGVRVETVSFSVVGFTLTVRIDP